MHPPPEPDPAAEDAPSLGSLLLRLGIALLVVFVVMGILGVTLAEPIEGVAAYFIAHFGVVGLFLFVFVMDAIPFTTHEPVLFLAYAGGTGYWTVFAVAGTASVCAGPLGWTCGRVLSRSRWLTGVFERYRVGPFLRRYGIAAIAIAALTPFPFAVMTWAAGAARMRPQHVLLGALLRYPKVLFYLTVMVLGWKATT